MHKSIIKYNPESDAFPYTYYSTALMPESTAKPLSTPQKLQIHFLNCLYFEQNGCMAALPL